MTSGLASVAVRPHCICYGTREQGLRLHSIILFAFFLLQFCM